MDSRRKRLIYLSNHRGMKETDLLLGRFAELNIEQMDDSELAQFDALMDESDNDLLNWILGRLPIPEGKDTSMLQNIIKFKNSL